MKTYFTLTPVDLNITAYESGMDALDTGNATFGTANELDQLLSEMRIKPADLWNSLPGLTPVKKFMDRKTGIARIWKQLQGLTPVPAKPVEAKKATKAQRVSEASQKRSTKKEPSNGAQAAHTPREGSKQQQVVDMMKRPEGATLAAIMAATDWQKHTVRGFIAGAAQKKLGLKIESFKNDGGERTYRVIA